MLMVRRTLRRSVYTHNALFVQRSGEIEQIMTVVYAITGNIFGDVRNCTDRVGSRDKAVWRFVLYVTNVVTRLQEAFIDCFNFLAE